MGSYTHADAEVVAATLAGMPDSLGGKRMAIYVAELARAGMTPGSQSRPKATSMASDPPRWWLAPSAC